MSSLRILIIFNLFVQILINTPKITSNTSCRLVGEPSIPDEWHDGRRNNRLHTYFSLDKNVTNGSHLGAIRTSTKTIKESTIEAELIDTAIQQGVQAYNC